MAQAQEELPGTTFQGAGADVGAGRENSSQTGTAAPGKETLGRSIPALQTECWSPGESLSPGADCKQEASGPSRKSRDKPRALSPGKLKQLKAESRSQQDSSPAQSAPQLPVSGDPRGIGRLSELQMDWGRGLLP